MKVILSKLWKKLKTRLKTIIIKHRTNHVTGME